MRLHHGWNAYVDDRQVKYAAYLDMLPAIPVKGQAHVIFRYEPESFRSGLKVSLAGLLVFLVFSGFCFRSAKKTKDPSTLIGVTVSW
jgi:uncharacterized membrane protein YfhO